MWKSFEKIIFTQNKSGERVFGVGFYLLMALIAIIPIVLFFRTDGAPLLQDKKRQQDGPSPIQMPESNLSAENDMPNTRVSEMERELQIVEEQSSALKPQEKEQRIQEIKDRYKQQSQDDRRSAARINFSERVEDFQKEPTSEKPVQQKAPETPQPQGYMTFAERLAADGQKTGGGKGGNNKVLVFKTPDKKTPSQQTNLGDVISVDGTPTQQNRGPSNLLPLGTFIPVTLDQDVISTDLQSHVWATVVQDVTFRRQLQLPLGLVKLRGKAAREPVQNLLDIQFEVMVFSDGTELPISGFAYSAFDIRYPNRFRVRGVPGHLTTPPMYTKLLQILLTAGLGASDAYIQNYINEQTTTDSTFTTVPQIDPQTGQVTTTLQQTQGQPVNNNIGASIGLGALQSGADELAAQISKDLEKYRPYVTLEKGTPLFVQLDSTVDVGKRRINGYAIAMEEKARANAQTPYGRSQRSYPPGDARSEWQPAVSETQAPNVGNMNIPNQEIPGLNTLIPPTTVNQPTTAIQAGQQNAQDIINQFRQSLQQQNRTPVSVQTP